MWTSRPRLGRSGRETGFQAEREAERYLCDQGLRALQRNYNCKVGEIDLVMRDGEALVFVEVRYRRQERYGSPAETVHGGKQKRFLRAVQHYLQAKGLTERLPCRCDVLSITGSAPPRIEWIKNAF